jgi:hypothetical protein
MKCRREKRGIEQAIKQLGEKAHRNGGGNQA